MKCKFSIKPVLEMLFPSKAVNQILNFVQDILFLEPGNIHFMSIMESLQFETKSKFLFKILKKNCNIET